MRGSQECLIDVPVQWVGDNDDTWNVRSTADCRSIPHVSAIELPIRDLYVTLLGDMFKDERRSSGRQVIGTSASARQAIPATPAPADGQPAAMLLMPWPFSLPIWCSVPYLLRIDSPMIAEPYGL